MIVTLPWPWMDANAKNMALPVGVGLILMRERNAAVWAQERHEAVHKRTPRGFWRYLRSADYRRETELMGHEIEVQVAVWLYGANEFEKRRQEAVSLSKYRDFEGWERLKIRLEMAARKEAAEAWIERHSGQIRRRK